MKKKKTISQFVATAFMALATVAPSFAQNNLGAACGCPAVSARATVDLNTLPFTTVNGSNEFSANVHLTCDKKWTFSNKWYVPNGLTMTIDPGTVIEGVYNADPTQSSCIIIERGGKIIADGTAECNIVMTTDQDPMNGTYSITNVCKWGGLVICGIATNNLISPTNDAGLGIAGKSGMGHCEGFVAANGENLFGANASDPIFTAFNDNDNSGVLRYVSVRHAGALVGGTTAGNEINGISLYSVGAGTTIEHVEVVASADDDIEYFGGTVNMKYISTLFGDDDKYDFDLGYSGKGQFYFSIAADSLNTGGLGTSDNGFECDADDQFGATTTSNHSSPKFYNVTMISNGHVTAKGDNTGSAGIQAKELTGGEWHNCIFSNFRTGVQFAEARSVAARGGDAYKQWTNSSSDAYLVANGGKAQPQALKVKNCVFVVNNSDGHKRYGFTRGTLVAVSGTQGYIKNPPTTIAPGIPNHADSVQFITTDGNQIVNTLAGVDYNFAFNGSNTGFTDQFHATPLANLTTSDLPPADGFFSVVNYKGAFDGSSPNSNWISGYAQTQVSSMVGPNANPTDINQDGVTDINDFAIFIGKFGQLDK